jgi:hypothetical protein
MAGGEEDEVWGKSRILLHKRYFEIPIQKVRDDQATL